jgi:endonuclease YncB( thermonuclease family)
MKIRGQTRRTSLQRYMAWRQRRRWLVATAVAALAAFLIWADHRGLLLYVGDDGVRYEGHPWRLAGVLSGDTIEVAAPDRAAKPEVTRIRLCGIMAPVSGSTAKGGRRPSQGEPKAAEAIAFVRSACAGGDFHLSVTGTGGREPSGCLRAYVRLPDGTDLNGRLLAAGLACCDGTAHRMSDEYQRAQDRARAARLGLWAVEPPDPGTEETDDDE